MITPVPMPLNHSLSCSTIRKLGPPIGTHTSQESDSAYSRGLTGSFQSILYHHLCDRQFEQVVANGGLQLENQSKRQDTYFRHGLWFVIVFSRNCFS